ncbi:hypothetical protein OsJ_24646 [Oryza sativa Japonica Group]|uniref:F-box domain-containing protein n=1 Tax=Oryza sativa subsp. japonica TaxID=39947 RepID=B9FXS5_ORYSJ|nr:hypothetical protein OsJ_24646 [Oryza sativa Japonica Group]
MAYRCIAHKRARLSGGSVGSSAGGGRGYGGPDRISRLPDELLHHVLSFVTTPEAVRTSALSRRWVGVWKRVPRLHLLEEEATKAEHIPDHYDGILPPATPPTWTSPTSPSPTTGTGPRSTGTGPPRGRGFAGAARHRPLRPRRDEPAMPARASAASSRGGARAWIASIELEHIAGVEALTLRTDSLLSLRLVSVSRLQRLDVEAGNLRRMRVEYCFDETRSCRPWNGGGAAAVMRLSAPALEELGWEDACPDEVERIRLPTCLRELVVSELPSHIIRSMGQSDFTKILELFSGADVLKLTSPMTATLDSEEQESLIYSVQLPYYSKLDLGVITKGHKSYGSSVVHFLKRNSSIRNLTLTLHPYHPECRGSSAPVGQPPQTLDPSPHVFRRHSSSPTKLECERASVSGGSDCDGDAAYECPDCISSLAAVLLHHILVFLPVVEAIRNCVLSHCWVCVWTGIPQLQLDDDAWRVDLVN